MSSIKIISTKDGSQSIYNKALDETYHSTFGALTESKHVFVLNGLGYFKNRGVQELNILEVGFGTGLNALLTQEFAIETPSIQINYTALEPFPLSKEIVGDLLYHKELSKVIAQKDHAFLHDSTWAELHQILPNFTFTKHKIELQKFDHHGGFNLVFYDAFSPSKQPEMWEPPALQKTKSLMSSGGALVTYCSKGDFKRALKGLGMSVEAPPGPSGKAQIVRATKV